MTNNPLLLLLNRFSRVQLCATLWLAAHQAPPSTGFSRHELLSGLPFPSPTWWMIAMHFTMIMHSRITGKIALVYIIQFLLYELI